MKLSQFRSSRWFRFLRFFCRGTYYFLTRAIRKFYRKRGSDLDSRLVFIISFPRSGTTALGSILQQSNTHVNYLGEFFALNHLHEIVFDMSIYYPFFAPRWSVGYLIEKRKWCHPHRFEKLKLDPTKALASLMKIPGTHVIKIFPTHLYNQTLEQLIKKFKPEIVFIRRNHLDRLISHKKAQATGVWHGVETDLLEVQIDEKELNECVQGHEQFYREVVQIARKASSEFLDVEYENLFSPNEMEKVLSFILKKPENVSKMSYKPRTIKQDSTRASQQTFLQKISEDGSEMKISDYNFDRLI